MHLKKILLGSFIFCSTFILTVASTLNSTKDIDLAQNMKILIIRHGEKVDIDQDHGVLNCQGINRSLLLPKFFKENYGRIDKIYAPKPFYTTKYNNYSIRPLETILPTASYFNTGVKLKFDVEKTNSVAKNIVKLKNNKKTVLVAWRHDEINDIAKAINDLYSGSCSFDKWKGKDFDSIYELNITDGVITCDKKVQGLVEKSDQSCPNM